MREPVSHQRAWGQCVAPRWRPGLRPMPITGKGKALAFERSENRTIPLFLATGF